MSCFLPMVWHNLESCVDIYAVCCLMDFQMKQSSSSYLPQWVENQSVCCVNMGKHACTVVHNLQRKTSHRVYVHLQQKQPASISFTLWNWIGFIYSLLPAYSHSGTQSGGCCNLSMHWQQGRTTIHHRDSKDKHIYTYIHLGFFSPDPTCASLLYRLPSPFTLLSVFY